MTGLWRVYSGTLPRVITPTPLFLTYNVENPNNWVITELWDSKEGYEKYLQFRQADGTLDEVASVCMDAPSVRIFDIIDTSS